MSTLEQQISAALDAIEQDGQRALSLNVGHLAFLELFGAGACEGDGCTTFRDVPVYVYRKGANPHHWEFEVVWPANAADDLPTLVDNLPVPGEDEYARLRRRGLLFAWAAIVFGLSLVAVAVAAYSGAFR